MVKFLRRNWNKYSKLGKRKKKKQVWRKPRGRDNKIREKRKGCPKFVSIGYKKNNSERKKIKTIKNIEDLEKKEKNEILVLGNMGKRKKIEIVKKAKEKKIIFQNINIEKFLKKIEKQKKPEKSGEKKK